MESQKRKEVPDSSGDGASDVPERPTKTRQLNESLQESVNTEVSIVAQDSVDETRIQAVQVHDGNGAAAATVASISNTIDIASLPSAALPHSVTNEPPIISGNLPIISTGIPVERSLELDAATGLADALKVPPKPSTPAEIAHWNQIFFNLMVC